MRIGRRPFVGTREKIKDCARQGGLKNLILEKKGGGNPESLRKQQGTYEIIKAKMGGK